MKICSVVAAWALAALWFAPIQAKAAPPVYHGCAPAPASYKRSFYVDPKAAAGGGSAAAPFNRLAQALAAAGPGDIIYLKSGQYDAVTINGQNAGFITVAAQPGETPVLDSLKVRSASHWIFSGLTLIGPARGGLGGNGWQLHDSKVVILDSSNIVVDRNVIGTTLGAYDWQPEVKGVNVTQSLASGVGAQNVSCLSVVGNRIVNVFIGISAGGDQSGDNGKNILIKGNSIDHFAGDAMDHQASHLLIQSNLITNGHDLCNNQCIHHDAIQGWNWNDRSGLLDTDVVIDGNLIIQQTLPNLAYPGVDMQGITIFDGNWDGVVVTNNVVITQTWHGVSLYGVQNGRVINNTVLSTNPERASWIMINHKKGDKGDEPYNVVVRNNIASSLMIGQRGVTVRGVLEDHNLVTQNPQSLVVSFDPKRALYDLHLKPRSSAKGAGSADMAPAEDIEGRARSGRVDLGAYAAGTTPVAAHP